MSTRDHSRRSRSVRFFVVFFGTLLLLPAQAQRHGGGWRGGAPVQPSEGWHGTPGLQPQGTPGLEWHGTPGLQGGQQWRGAPNAPGWAGRQDWHGGRDWRGNQAWHGDQGRHGDLGWHSDHAWRGGQWHHGAHDGRDGWWWVVGPSWYYYPAPIYPYPEPYVWPLYVPPPPPSALYCPNFAAYYPNVTACPGGWVQVPVGSAAP